MYIQMVSDNKTDVYVTDGLFSLLCYSASAVCEGDEVKRIVCKNARVTKAEEELYVIEKLYETYGYQLDAMLISKNGRNGVCRLGDLKIELRAKEELPYNVGEYVSVKVNKLEIEL